MRVANTSFANTLLVVPLLNRVNRVNVLPECALTHDVYVANTSSANTLLVVTLLNHVNVLPECALTHNAYVNTLH